MAIAMRTFMTLLITILLADEGWAESNQSKKRDVIYKYKKREKIDLGSLEIQGKIIAPGDLSIEKRSRKVFSRDLHSRPNFLPEIKKDINNLNQLITKVVKEIKKDIDNLR